MESRVSHYRGLMGNEISLFVHCCPFWALSFLKQRKRVHKKRSKGTTGDRKYKKGQKGTSRDKKGHIFSYWNCVISYNLHFNFYIKHMYNVYINIYISYIYIYHIMVVSTSEMPGKKLRHEATWLKKTETI